MLLNYIEAFRSLNVHASAERGRKPYKPALLLAVIDGIEAGQIQKNQIRITPELVCSFRKFREQLGAVGKYNSRHFAYPFYHLKSEYFWRLKLQPERQIRLTAANTIASLKQLQEDVDYAQLDMSLWDLLVTPSTRSLLREVLLGQYQNATGEER